eukprot:TRINITY_DN1481_c0_g1_i1.p1 TRINITY_DN1481_c0_g1~~TRINITY_DN1481_c0_g1_i1.p1  ORF type:complete len:698 (-),score=160.68 TRINITY_DN1481_c0_g1_i1:107-2200(-)
MLVGGKKSTPTIRQFRSGDPMDEKESRRTWECLRHAIHQIHNHNASSLSFEELYRNAYNLVLHKYGELLYNGVHGVVADHLKAVAQTCTDCADDRLLEELKRQWDDHKTTMVMIRDILMYMDRNFVSQYKKVPVYEMGLVIFRENVPAAGGSFVPTGASRGYNCSTPAGDSGTLLDFRAKPAPNAKRRSGSAVDILPGAIRKSSTREKKRSSSVAAQVLGRSAPAAVAAAPVLRVTVTVVSGTPDARVSVSLEGARPDGRGLPAVCRAGENAAVATYLSAPALRGSKGSIEIDGFNEPVPFSLAHGGQAGSWLNVKGRYKFTALQVQSWDWRGGSGEKPTEGRAADLELVTAGGASGPAELRVHVRGMTVMELKRSSQLLALNEAAEGTDYDTLRAQVTKARMASVEMEHIARGEARLKELREQGLHVNEGCDHATVREQMSWTRVTDRSGAPDVNEPCTACDDCPCNVALNPGEVFECKDGAVQACLQDAYGQDADRRLFDALVEGALAAEEGCIWRAGGKFIFSEFNRNQSVVALSRMLNKVGQQTAADMLQRLLQHTEKTYFGFVTAIQVNFHPHKGTYHDQHRDIYSQKQSAGPNCTCQFQECVGTVCYSLGSSRLSLLTTMTDDMSLIKPCGDSCEGRREYRWLHSGNAMFFNGDWNNNHTHGIPPSEEECGPRISLAFLLAAKPPVMVCRA